MTVSIPLPEKVSGGIGFVLEFTPAAIEDILDQTKDELVPGMKRLLEGHTPHCTLSHAKVRHAPREHLETGLKAIRAGIPITSALTMNSLALIGGRFQVAQARAPQPDLQLAAFRAACVLRPWLDRQAISAAIQEGLTLTAGELWCLEEFGHPLALPDPLSGRFDRSLHVSFGYWEGTKPVAYYTKPFTIHAPIANVRLAEMGPLGVVERFFDV